MNTESAIEIEPSAAPTVAQQLSPSYVRSELFVHGLFLAMACGVLLLSFLMRSEGESSVYMPGFNSPMPETCAAKRLFGIDCPGCGMTRAFISISSGQFVRAWNFNRAGIVLYLFVLIQLPWHLMQIWRLKKNRLPIVTAWAYMAPITMVVLISINWVWNLFTGF